MRKIVPTIALFAAVALWPAASSAQQMFEGPAPGLTSIAETGYLPSWGDLVKLKSDNDPTTTSDEAVYYIDQDLSRRAFPNRRVYESWYEDFSSVREISGEELARIKLAANVTYRPGTRLVKVPSIPKVYAVEPGGILRWIETESVAIELFGPDWAQRVDDVPESFFLDYAEGSSLTAPIWPTGTVVRRASDTALFVLEGMFKRHVRPGVASQVRIQERNVIETDSDLSAYSDGQDIVGAEQKLNDTGQQVRSEVQAPPIFDFPANPPDIVPGQEVSLYAMRLSTGMPVLMREMSLVLEGNLWDGNEPLLTDLRWEDQNGQRMFGLRQLETPGAAAETVAFSGSYMMPERSVRVIVFRARVSDSFPADGSLSASLDRDSFSIADGGNGNRWSMFWPSSDFESFELGVTAP